MAKKIDKTCLCCLNSTNIFHKKKKNRQTKDMTSDKIRLNISSMTGSEFNNCTINRLFDDIPPTPTCSFSFNYLQCQTTVCSSNLIRKFNIHRSIHSAVHPSIYTIQIVSPFGVCFCSVVRAVFNFFFLSFCLCFLLCI